VQQSAGWLKCSMEIALNQGSDRQLRLAAEAVASAILNGEPEARVREAAIDILSAEGEISAMRLVDRILSPPTIAH
jgi:hypothetical protein